MLLFRAELGLASFLIFFTCLSSSLNSDGLSLLALKAAIVSDPTGVLDTWSESDLVPCHWGGISCTHGRVTGVFLPNRSFTGYIPSELGALVNLRQLSLANNNFSKPIPSRLFNATTLLSLDLSHNSLSGPLPTQVKALKYLVHLDLSSNLLIGFLLEELAELENLDESLNQSHNLFRVQTFDTPICIIRSHWYTTFATKNTPYGLMYHQHACFVMGNNRVMGKTGLNASYSLVIVVKC